MRAGGLFAAIVLATSIARAQPTAADVSLAQSLFEDGTELMRRGNYAEACPKLAESQRLDPGGGTLVNLAVCLEKDQKYASAYLAYNEALGVALRDGNKTRETLVRDRLAAVMPLVAKVVIRVTKEVDGLEVRFDTANVRRAAWGVAAPVDTGDHVVTASAPGKRDWRGVISVDKPGALIEVKIPVLDDLPQQPEPAPPLAITPVPGEEHPSHTQRNAAFVLWGTAGLAVVAGTITGAIALARHGDSGCKDGVCSTPAGIAAERDANGLGWAANISFGTAIVAAAIGTVLYLTAPKARRESLLTHHFAW